MFQAASGDLVSDIEIQNQATNNDEATFRDHVFPARFQDALLSRLDRNDKLVFSYLDNSELQADLIALFAPDVHLGWASPCCLARWLSGLRVWAT